MFKIEFDTGNAAFEESDTAEIHRILENIWEQLAWRSEGSVIDINGNRIGSWKYVKV